MAEGRGDMRFADADGGGADGASGMLEAKWVPVYGGVTPTSVRMCG